MGDVLLVAALVLGSLGAWWLVACLRAVPPGAAPAPGRRVSVVVPARDEEASLPVLLRSLHRQTVAVEEVVVVDDGSRDATARVAADLGARVLTPGPPPPGWTGKAWACDRGAEDSRGDLLLFLDADTELEPDAVAGLLAVHEREGGLVSVQPFHHVVRAYENLSAYFNAVAVLASGVFARRSPGRPMAFGPCLLTSREDHVLTGGHASVRGAILDDVRLAVAYRDAGLPVTCLVGGRTIRMRSYPGGLRQLASGWTKNVASGAAAADPRATLAAVLWICAHHAVAVGLLVALWDASTAGASPLAAARPVVLVGAWVVVACQLRWVLGRLGDFRWWTWVLFPVPLLAFDVVFARSAALTLVRRSVRWRGRAVDLREAA